MIRRQVDEHYATVGAREYIDGASPSVELNPNRQTDLEDVVLYMTPKTARALALRLNRWARLVETPSRRR